MSFAILGLGTALPKNAVPQQRAAQVVSNICCRDADQAEMLMHLFEHTSINTRHVIIGEDVVTDILDGTRTSHSVFLPSGEPDDHGPTTRQRMQVYMREALPLAVNAVEKALAESRVPPSSITHLVTVSCTGFAAPGVDVALIKQLHLAPTVQRTNVGFMGCHGAINGLRVAQAYAESSPGARVLLCAVELCSLHWHYQWDPKRNIANALFSDGAAAVVGESGGRGSCRADPVGGAAGSAGASPSQVNDWRVVGTGSCLFPDTGYAMKWTIGDHGFEMGLSGKIPTLIGDSLRPWVEGWLADQGQRIEDIGSWAVHPGGPRILDAVEESLCLPRGTLDVSREVLADCGNMSSPTVLFILERLRRQNAPRPCVVLGFGPGLIAEAALIK
jgi:predicted naringenin-chalcone synthase